MENFKRLDFTRQDVLSELKSELELLRIANKIGFNATIAQTRQYNTLYSLLETLQQMTDAEYNMFGLRREKYQEQKQIELF